MNENELLATRIDSATQVLTSYKNADPRALSEACRSMLEDAVKFLAGQYAAPLDFPCKTARAEKPKSEWES